MKAETLKRLFRLIQDSSHPGLSTFAHTIVDEERRMGHGSLAAQLEKILAQARPTKEVKEPTLAALPDSGRNAKAFASWLPPEILRHHMVLPSRIEARFQRIEREYVARDRLARHGLNYRKRILLHGPPGCGKTLGAERLAWTTGLPLMKVRLDAVMSSYFGESAANLRSIFESVRTVPTLLFLDECDFVGRSRTNTNDVGEVPRIVNTLLVLLEEYQGPGMVVAATNLDSALDRALFRRFDEILEIPPPGLDEINALLRLTLSAIAVDESVRWEEIAQSLLGSSAANVVKVAQDAAKAALLDERKTVTESDLQEAVKELERNG